MDCVTCERPTVAFEVPPSLRDYAPEEASAVRLCTRCLRTTPADEGSPDPSFDAVLDGFPDGEAGVALALALGRLDSLALNREAVVDLCDRAERDGVDVYLTLDRLDAAGAVEPHFDLGRRREQLASFR